jgi:hypothetical protein
MRVRASTMALSSRSRRLDLRSAPRGETVGIVDSEPVREKVELGESVVIPWLALLFRRRADVES